MKPYQIPDSKPQAIPWSPPYPAGQYLFKVLLLTVLIITLIIKGTSAQCVPPYLTFNSPKLITGTDNAIGAVYLFPDVMPGIDANVEIMDIVGGASLSEIDNTTGAGYFDAFQPYVLAAANDTSYIDWKITFKVAGTDTDTSFECLAVTAIDIDGNNKDIKEFVEAATPGSFAVDPATNLTVSFDGVRSRAEGQIATIPLIDTNQRQAMFQMNFTNINSLLYRNGAIATGNSMVRQTCIYFAPFFQNFTILPIKLLSFSAQSQTNGVLLNWSATNEQEVKSYTVQKSTDGKNWKDLSTLVTGINLTNSYRAIDPEKNKAVTYYRLKQRSTKEYSTYSKIIKTSGESSTGNSFSNNSIFTNRIDLNVQAPASGEYEGLLYSITGRILTKQRISVHGGNNTIQIQTPDNIPSGIYLLSIRNNAGQKVYTSKLIKD